MKVLNAINEFIVKVAVVIAQVSLASLLIFVETLARYLFDRPIAWMIEVPCFLQSIATAMALAYTQKVRGHIAVGIVESQLKDPKKLAAFSALLLPIYIVIVAFITGGVFEMFKTTVLEHRTSIGLQLPLIIPHAFMLVGFVMYLLQLIIDLYEEIFTWRTGQAIPGKSHGVLSNVPTDFSTK
jgi:TRAP-type C4-dicarboxylate transport system permease small subunit